MSYHLAVGSSPNQEESLSESHSPRPRLATTTLVLNQICYVVVLYYCIVRVKP